MRSLIFSFEDKIIKDKELLGDLIFFLFLVSDPEQFLYPLLTNFDFENMTKVKTTRFDKLGFRKKWSTNLSN